MNVNMHHVSAHARVFDGVRTARIRAFDESLLPPDLFRQICGLDDDPAVALWVHADTGHTTALCAIHLKTSLETYREEKDSAPPAVIPIRRRRNSA